MQIIGIWIVFDHFWAIPDPKSQIWGSHFWPIFFLQNIGMWGVQSDAMWCPVFLRPFQTEGTHSEAQNGKKVVFTAIMDPKSQFLVPHFRPIFFLFKIWACGVSRAMPCDTRSFCNPFKRKGTHSEAQNGQKINFMAILDQKTQFFGCFELLSGSPGFVMWCLGLTQPFQTQGTKSVAQNGKKIGI